MKMIGWIIVGSAIALAVFAFVKAVHSHDEMRIAETRLQIIQTLNEMGK